MAKLQQIPKVALVKRIGSAYGSAARGIVSALSGLDPATYTAAAGAAAMSRVRAIVADLDSRAGGWAARAVKAAYSESRAVASTRLEAIGAKPPKPKRGATAAEVRARRERQHAKAVARLIRVTAGDYIKANHTILTTAGKYLALVQHARRKLNGYREAEMQAFTSSEVRQMINSVVVKGTTQHLARKALDKQILARLLDRLKGADFVRINGRNYNLRSYSELVARTRMRQAQTEAVKKSCEEYENDLVHIPSHGDPCPSCAEYQDKVYSISGKHPDYPKLPDDGPPFHPNCLLPGTRFVSPGGVVSGHRAFYNGPAVEIVLAQGARVSVTVNHMFLTPNGFAPAHLLRQGDDVFYCSGFEGIVAPGPDGDKCPPLVEDVVGALAKAGGMTTTRVPMAPEYLHGDGRFCDGQVDVIRADGLLRNDGQSGPTETGGQYSLDPRSVALLDLFPDGPLVQILHRAAHAADSIMGGRRSPASFFLTRTACGDPVRFADGSNGDAALDKPTVDDRRADAEYLRELAFESAGQIATAKVLNVKVFRYRGHVYDLQAVTSLYLGNGMLSSNCEDVMNPTSELALRWRNS